MDDLHPDRIPREEPLRQFLVEHFPEPKGKVSSVAGAPHPLLLLQLQREVAGFSVSNGDPQSCFEESYAFFKRLYANHEREWDELNLTFVFCLARRDRELEAFRAQIETNRYFCRKFTVVLDAPLETEFARLPFFPLEHQKGGFRRPPSAQTLLKSCGVSATLAAQIVGRVGEGTIVQDCLKEPFGERKFIVPEMLYEASVGEDSLQAVRLLRLEVENFRAYRHRQAFDLDADFILLYGPNGFGKTSFFDAVDFAATGDIGRLGLARDGPRFTKAATHLEALPSESSSVTISFQSQDGAHKIRRTVRQRNAPHLDSGTADRKKALLELTCSAVPPSAEHVDHLVGLFRATHLFSQESQKLTEGFREHCQLSAEVVSRMLAFEDYVNARGKTGKVLDVMNNRVTERDRQMKELFRSIMDKLAEFARLDQSARHAESPQGIAGLRASVRKSLVSVGIEHPADDDPLAEVRGWRGLLEARINDTLALGNRLSELAEKSSVIDTQRAQLSSQQADYAQTIDRLVEARKQVNEQREAISKADSDLAALTEQEQGLRQRVEALAWLRENKPAYDTLIARHATLTGEIGVLTKTLADQSKPLEELKTAHNTAESRVTETTRTSEANRSQMALLMSLIEGYPQWQLQVDRRHELEKIAAQTGNLIAGLQRELRETTSAMGEAEIEEGRAADLIAGIESTQSDLQNLLVALEPHVVDAHCPACGAVHQSKDELLQRLREQRNVGAVSDAATAQLQHARSQVATLGARLGELRLRLQNAQESADASTVELETVLTEIEAFEAIVRQLGFGPTDEGLLARIREARSTAERTASELAQTVDSLERNARAAKTAVEAAGAEARTRQRDLLEKEQALEEVAKQLKRVRSEAARRQVTLDNDIHSVSEAEASTRSEADQVGVLISTKRIDLSNARSSLSEHDRRTGTIERAVATQAAAIGTLQLAVETYERELEALGFAHQAEQAQIAARADEELRRIPVLEQLKQNVTSLEMAIDAATTSAAAAQVTTEIQEADDKLSTFLKQQSEDKLWIEYFEDIQAKLLEIQTRAVTSYTEGYGPLTSIIQRRLRAVSGFQDISLHPEEGGIKVRVARNGEHLPPTDFFSESEEQVLILSLFLTACMTQTWSAFAPILLDDPVTHFDDLNAYSFLDLIGGLMESGLPRRQFILSTCDDRLFQLARQRFQYLGDRTRVYRFISRGLDGPVIESS